MRRRLKGRHPLAAVLFAALALMIVLPASPALAAPDDEGGTPELRAALDAANRGFIEAQALLDGSKKKQGELVTQLGELETRHAKLSEETATIAVTAYRTGGLRTASALLDSPSPDAFIDRVTTINTIAMRNDKLLRQLTATREELNAKKTAIDGEITTQQQQVEVMAKKKQEAEKALQNHGNGSGQNVSGPSGAGAKTAVPAPRKANGTWPDEPCSQNDPSPADGCVTPRLLHAYNQTKAAGFGRYVSCYRSGGSGEHPKGQACDWAAQTNGFGGVATGGDRTYGDNLAAYYIKNANALGVMYVIWFKRIWQAATGSWKSYSGGNGDPSSDHTNHVHLSVY